MSTKTETAEEKFRQWKRDLDGQCSAWLESHPEGAENLNTSDILSRPEPLRQLGTGGRSFPDNIDPKFQSQLLPNEMDEKNYGERNPAGILGGIRGDNDGGCLSR